MARIAGINIPPQQHAEIGLTAIYGIGRPRARQILNACGIPCTKKVQDLDDAELERIVMPFPSSPLKAISVVRSSSRSSV